MKKIIPLHKTYPPSEIAIQLMGILMLIGGSWIVAQMIGVYTAPMFFDIQVSDFMNMATSTNPDLINALKYNQLFSVLGLFIIPALLIPKIFYKYRPSTFLNLHRATNFKLLFLSVVAFISVLPFLAQINVWNQMMDLPNGGLEDWMVSKEKEMMNLTLKFLIGTDTNTLLINLLIMAVLPAVAEELFFRGFLQRTLFLYTRKIHLSIFIGAFIFSAIHLQFFGFFPRFLLGLVFGYVLYWTGDLKIPILLHFINNAFAVLQGYYQQKEGKAIDFNEDPGFPIYLSILGIGLTVLFFYMIYKNGSLYVNDDSEDFHSIKMENDVEYRFIPVYSAANQIQAEIMMGGLRQEGFEVMMNNSQSSAYPIFGNIQLLVPDFQVVQVIEYLKFRNNEDHNFIKNNE